ncbi:MAG TPA: hypothetical protein VFF78_06555, partial [Anaerolineaceae bacterium]|nr:hypothetical protein [Anaerolineaceae bacterium]
MNAIPTLAVEDARARLTDLLANNGVCQLPCLWGITPGTTTNQEAATILAPLSSLSNFAVFDFDIGTIYIEYKIKDDLRMLIDVVFESNQDDVYHVHFQGRASKELGAGNGWDDDFDSTDFGERLDFYMLHQVLTTYGRPSSVLLFTYGEFPSPRYGQGHFKLILIYPKQGIMIQYTTEMRVVGDNVEGCLANAHIMMDLFPPENPGAFDEYVASTELPSLMAYYKPLEEVTSLSIDDFYELFRQPTDECLVTPANLWPTPEN